MTKYEDGDGTKTRKEACESRTYVVIAYGKFQPSGISGKVTGDHALVPRDTRRLELSIGYHTRTATFTHFPSFLRTVISLLTHRRVRPLRRSALIADQFKVSTFFRVIVLASIVELGK